MKILGIIPARYASSRFPGKPLVMINGISMIKRVYLQAVKSKDLGKVLIATDDERIYNHCRQFTDAVVLTSPLHVSGTDRCVEALSMEKEQWDGVVNIQGDEPFIDPAQIDLLCALLKEGASVGTLIKVVTDTSDLFNINIPKVVIDASGKALYFSRQAVPFLKGFEQNQWLQHHVYYKHIGIYGYKASVLPHLTKLPHGRLEQAESLEQLRWLEHGFSIQTSVTELETIAIDTPDDLRKAGDKM